jgi:hypothetical protein
VQARNVAEINVADFIVEPAWLTPRQRERLRLARIEASRRRAPILDELRSPEDVARGVLIGERHESYALALDTRLPVTVRPAIHLDPRVSLSAPEAVDDVSIVERIADALMGSPGRLACVLVLILAVLYFGARIIVSALSGAL